MPTSPLIQRFAAQRVVLHPRGIAPLAVGSHSLAPAHGLMYPIRPLNPPCFEHVCSSACCKNAYLLKIGQPCLKTWLFFSFGLRCRYKVMPSNYKEIVQIVILQREPNSLMGSFQHDPFLIKLQFSGCFA